MKPDEDVRGWAVLADYPPDEAWVKNASSHTAALQKRVFERRPGKYDRRYFWVVDPSDVEIYIWRQ